jgi:hypothetical protein
MFFVAEVANAPRLLLSASQICSGCASIGD